MYEEFAKQFQAEYELFLFALTGRYLSIALPGIEVSPKLVTDLFVGANDLRRTFTTTANRLIRTYAKTHPFEGNSERVVKFESETFEFASQNVEFVVERLRGVRNSTLDLYKNMHGGMGLLLQQKLATPDFRLKTLSGRTYKAVPLMTSQARDFAYQTWVRSELDRIAQTSDLAEVVYLDATKERNGMVFSITGASQAHPSFQEIEHEVFHYNATARVRAHVHS